MKKPIKLGERLVGVVEDGVYITRRKRDTHYYKKYGGYGIDILILQKLRDMDVSHIRLEEIDTNTTYRTTLDVMWAHGILVDHGFGEQLILPTKYWEVIPQGQITLL